MQLQFIALRQGNPGKLPAPVDAIEEQVDAMTLAGANHALKYYPRPERRASCITICVILWRPTGVDELMLILPCL